MKQADYRQQILILKTAKHCYIKYIKETSYILVYTRKSVHTEGFQEVIAFVN